MLESYSAFEEPGCKSFCFPGEGKVIGHYIFFFISVFKYEDVKGETWGPLFPVVGFSYVIFVSEATSESLCRVPSSTSLVRPFPEVCTAGYEFY